MDKINNFLSLHQILYPNDKYNILEKSETSIVISYMISTKSNMEKNDNNKIEIKYIYNLKKNFLEIEIINIELSNINDENNLLISKHISRLIDTRKLKYIKISENTIIEFIFDLKKIINEYYNYCTICGLELEIKGLTNISYCNNSQCITKSYETVIDNNVINSYIKDPEVFSFLLEFLIIGTQHNKGELAFTPLPIISNITNLQELKKLINKNILEIEKNKLITSIKESKNDLELIEKINLEIYAIIKNAISNNYFSMSSRDEKEFSIININYSADIENKFPQKYFLFHGSDLSSWYPIIKNGLKIMSNTKLMANGSAHGNGIYFSDSFQLASGYASIKNKICGYGKYKVVGVFEILEDPIKWKKTNNIYVIDDDKVILLRNIVLFNSNHNNKNINDYFLKMKPIEKQINKLGIGTLKSKRLEIEYKKLSSLDFINLIIVEDNYKWNIKLKKIKSKNIELEIFFSNYPINPPTIKLINSKIKINGFIEKNGNILLDLLNPNNWIVTNNLSVILNTINKCFEESL